MHFALPFPLLLLLSCHENMLWLACFCWIKYILPIPTHHLTVLSCLLFFHLYNSLLCSVILISLYITSLQTILDTSAALEMASKYHHLLRSQHCCLLGHPALPLTPWEWLCPCHPHTPPATSSPSQATPLCLRAEKAIKGEKENKRKLKFIQKNTFGKTVSQERCLFHFPLRDNRKREEFLKSYNEILLWMSHD